MKTTNMGEKKEVDKGEEKVIRCKREVIQPDLIRWICW